MAPQLYGRRFMRNGDSWTEARFNSFVKSSLRKASVKWPPRYQALADAFVGVKINKKSGRPAKHYKCAECKDDFPASAIAVDHIEPIVPVTGFTTWDEVINNLFCEKDGLQVLCSECHKIKSKEENALRKANKDNNNV